MRMKSFARVAVALLVTWPAWAAADPVDTGGPFALSSRLTLRGEFDRAAVSLPRRPSEARAAALREWLDAFADLNQQREELRAVDHQTRKAKAVELADEGKWGEAAAALRQAATTCQYRIFVDPYQADGETAFRNQDWVRKIARGAAAEAELLRRRGQWEDAAEIYQELQAVFRDDKSYREQAKACWRHARLEMIYEPEKREWENALDGIDMRLVEQALGRVELNYVRPPDLRAAATEGLEALLPLADTPQLQKTFPTLGDNVRCVRFRGRIQTLIGQVRAADAVFSRNVHTILKDAIAINADTVALPPELIITEFFEGFTEPLDRFTAMIWPSELAEFKKHTTGKFSGVGIQIALENGRLTVSTPLPDTPAYEAGIMRGDVIIAVDGKDTKGITLTQAVRWITGPPKTPVTLRIQPADNGKPRDVTIVRDTIVIKTVKGFRRADDGKSWEFMIDPDQKIGYVYVTNFQEDTVADLDRCITGLARDGLRGLILDLRFNPGGLLSSAEEMCQRFLDRGDLIVTTKGRGDLRYDRKAGPGPRYPDVPLIVLTNSFSASGSEIVAGAIQDHGRGPILGERTFGKFSVQHVIRLAGDVARLKLTTAQWFTPNQKSRQRDEDSTEWGVEPDIKVTLMPKEHRKVLDLRRDNDVVRGKNQTARPATAPASQPASTQPDDDGPPAPDVDPQLEAALLVMRVKLLSELPWPANLRADAQPVGGAE